MTPLAENAVLRRYDLTKTELKNNENLTSIMIQDMILSYISSTHDGTPTFYMIELTFNSSPMLTNRVGGIPKPVLMNSESNFMK